VPFFKIPEEQVSGLAKLQALSPEIVSRLRDALALAAAKKESADFLPADIGTIEGLEEPDIEELVDAITALHHARAFYETPINEFVDDVIASLKSTPRSKFSTEAGAISAFKERIRGFLDLSQLALAAKSNVLRFEHERTMHGVRILTDARPIFGTDVEKPPEAIALSYVLKLSYRRNGRLEEEFFAMDEEDLQSLKKAVSRAELKAMSLRTVLAKQIKVMSQG
jgi:hypothetical protein